MHKIMLAILVAFIILMLFFDENSYLIHKELDNEIEKLEKTTDYYKKEIKKDKKMIEELDNSETLEKFAREEYKMKKEKEDIYLIEFDTID